MHLSLYDSSEKVTLTSRRTLKEGAADHVHGCAYLSEMLWRSAEQEVKPMESGQPHSSQLDDQSNPIQTSMPPKAYSLAQPSWTRC